MPKFYVLQRDFSKKTKQFDSYTITATNKDNAWEKIEIYE